MLLGIHAPAVCGSLGFRAARSHQKMAKRPNQHVTRAKANEKDPSDPYRSKELIDELMDTSQLGQRGEAWVLGQFALMGLAVAAPGQLAPLIYVPGVALLGGGLGMMIWGSESLGSSLSPLPKPRKHGELVTDGAYAVVRHPLYTGLVASTLGLACLTDSVERGLFAGLLYALLFYKAKREEEWLIEYFGTAYEEYQKQVPSLIPKPESLKTGVKDMWAAVSGVVTRAFKTT